MIHSDYLVVGSGLAGLSFATLMAKSGKKVTVLEAHYLPGGYGHTFDMGGYKFNAQFHYVWNCGEGRTVHRMLKKLNLHETVTFEQYDTNGFDHMRMTGCALDIPNDYSELISRLQKLFPADAAKFEQFIQEIKMLSETIDKLPRFSPLNWKTIQQLVSKLPRMPQYVRLYPYRNLTLQDVFDKFSLPAEAQTLLALQWADFLLPPNQLSFIAWLMLFTGYMRGAYYPTHHFEHVINSLVQVIEENGGQVLYEHRVIEFLLDNKQVKGVKAEQLTGDGAIIEFQATNTICNMDPRRAAEMIGLEKFTPKVRAKLNYGYSASNFMAYCVVEGIDLRDYGFGKWNVFHTEEPDLNQAFYKMYDLGDYSKPSFAITTPSLLTDDRSDAPEGHQIMEFLTVANYARFFDLKLSSPTAYRKKKQEIFDAILDVMESHYIPNLREHIVFKTTGSPTTNERYCWSPAGNSYGSDMIPENIGGGRLNHQTSLNNFYFCNASSGYPGFAGTIWTGCNLYEILTHDVILR